MSLPYWPVLMRRKTAAAYLDMSEDTFVRLVASGSLPDGAMWGRSTYWKRDALDAAISATGSESDWEAQLYEKIKRHA